MKVNSSTLAKQIANTLDEMDKNPNDKKVEASVWNQFVKDKGGKQISKYIDADDAIKSLVVYLCRQAKEKSRLIVELGQEWIKNLEGNRYEEVDFSSKNQPSKISKVKPNIKKKHCSTKKKVDTSYSKLSREKALEKAKNDSRLEKLNGGKGWSVAKDSFITDIPYARKYTGEILSFVSSIIGENLVVTSALGTAGTAKNKTPHKISRSYCTHHNAENPKLDIRTNGNSKKLQRKLLLTGMFSRVSVEPDHLDIQIKNEVYLAFENGHNMDYILACAKSNRINELLT